MPNLTTNFSFNQPLVANATDADLWGGQLNTNWGSVDTYLALTTSSKSADFNVVADEFNYTYLIDASGGAVTATLPSTIPFNGFTVRFKGVDVSNTVTIDGNGNTLDGAATITIDATDQITEIVSDGTNWQIVNRLTIATTSAAGIVEKATQAELTAGTADKYPDCATLAATRFTNRTSPSAMAANTLYTVAHGLGVVPDRVTYSLRCITAEHGYAIGDEIKTTYSGLFYQGAAQYFGIIFFADTTNVKYRTGINGVHAVVVSTGTIVTLTPARWEVIIVAEAF